LPEHAQFAFRQRTKPRFGTKSELDVASEIAFVIDVARRAVRALRQFVQALDPRFGAAAARAQQIPAHRQNAAMLRGEKQLHRVGRRRAPKPGQGQRPDAAQRHARRLLQVRGELGR
jgi:hypothetical protein